MKILDHKLFIEFAEMEACDVPRRTILSWDNIKDPTDKRKVLIDYDGLQAKYQDKIVKRFGDPYTYVHNQAIKQFLKIDIKANDFFTDQTKTKIALSKEKINEYITCSRWLNLLIEVDNNWSKCKGMLSMTSKPELYDAAIRIFEAENIKLPKVYVPLKRKIKAYRENGYGFLISGKLGNQNSVKVKDEFNHALLLEMLSHGNQYDDTFISKKYNMAAKVAGFEQITPVTVGNYRVKFRVEIEASRKGNKNWYDYAGKDIHQDRPSAPLLLINSDDNELDVYFQSTKLNKKGKEVVNPYYRPVLYIVLDAFNDYILGYAIGDTNTKDLIKAAYLDAANHVRHLTGERYFWHQIKTDRWGIDRKKSNDFSQWFSNQAEFTPTLLHNARGKVIESTFKGNWSSKLKELFPINYSSGNITSKAKANRDWLEANVKNFPTVEEVGPRVAEFINELRHIKDANGKTKQQQWLDAFASMQQKHKRVISDEQHLMLLGYDHINRYKGTIETNTITKSGLVPTINGQTIIFEIPKERYLETLGTKVKVKYDPYDMSQVLAISTDEKTRLVCSQYNRVPMAKADWTDDTENQLNNRIAEKFSHTKQIRESKEERQAILKRHMIDAESVLTAGVMRKELKQAATQIQQGNYFDFDDEDDSPVDVRDLM